MPKIPLTATPHAFYVRPAPGWLDVVHAEVTHLIQMPLQKYKFEPKLTALKSTIKIHRCDYRQGLEILLRLTTAHDVEWLIMESKCNQWSEVEAILNRVPWNEILPNREVPVHVASDVSKGFTEASGKLREVFCRVAQVQHVSEGGELRFKIELRGELLRILISLAGAPLYKRGYKAKLIATAPLPEHQAAACTRWVLGTEAKITSIFVPFAGSGTLGFEALLTLSGSGPGAFPRSYTCESFPFNPKPTMDYLRRKLTERLKGAPLPTLVFNEINPDALSILKENVDAFSSPSPIEITPGDLFQLNPSLPKEGKTLILLNPPYGDRLAKASDVAKLYTRIGAYFHHLAKTSHGTLLGGCLCPDESTWRSFLKAIQVSSHETHHFTHGGKPMRIVRWEA